MRSSNNEMSQTNLMVINIAREAREREYMLLRKNDSIRSTKRVCLENVWSGRKKHSRGYLVENNDTTIISVCQTDGLPTFAFTFSSSSPLIYISQSEKKRER